MHFGRELTPRRREREAEREREREEVCNARLRAALLTRGGLGAQKERKKERRLSAGEGRKREETRDWGAPWRGSPPCPKESKNKEETAILTGRPEASVHGVPLAGGGHGCWKEGRKEGRKKMFLDQVPSRCEGGGGPSLVALGQSPSRQALIALVQPAYTGQGSDQPR